MGKPCGEEYFGGESITQVAKLLEISLHNQNIDTKCIVYDDACHLKRQNLNSLPNLQKLETKVDRFHFTNHIGEWCRKNMDPSTSNHLKNVNTEVMEQIFSWLKGYAPSLRYMKRFNYKFFYS